MQTLLLSKLSATPIMRRDDEPIESQDLTVSFLVPIELAEKIRVVCEKTLAWCFTPCRGRRVPDSPDTDKEVLGIRIERTLKRRVERAAAKDNLTVTEFVRAILVRETLNVTLSSADYEAITKKVREAEQRKKGK